MMIDYNYFDNIDTEEKAYWLGFFFADGSITTPSRKRKDGTIKNGIYRIELSLSDTDHKHMEKYNKALGIEKPIPVTKTNFKTDRCRSYFNSKHMWETLNSYGCTPRKSLTLIFPNIKIFKDKCLIRHFIRGYVDGDGCLTFSKSGRLVLQILGTKEFLSGIQKIFPQFHIYKKDKRSNVYAMSCACTPADEVAKKLYSDATIFLKRKYDRFCRAVQK